jgi:Domain of unknown function (DUF4269)
MPAPFDTIDYLKTGNAKQQLAYQALKKHQVLAHLQPFDPILAGTIPIDIDIENSDLDIICYCQNLDAFEEVLQEKFGSASGFKIGRIEIQDAEAVVANFQLDAFEIEIFGQNIPTRQQNAYRHMLIEYKLLREHGEQFRQKVIDLKRQGHKTEPAFALLLGLAGDPYKALLDIEDEPTGN